MITFLIMFLKLSAKLYTSVFHHGLKVGELQQGTGDWVDPAEARKENYSPQLTGRSQHPPPRGHAVPPFSVSTEQHPPPPQRQLQKEDGPEGLGGGGGGGGWRTGCGCRVTARRTLSKPPFLIPWEPRVVSAESNHVTLFAGLRHVPSPRPAVPNCLPSTDPPLPLLYLNMNFSMVGH